MKTSLKNISNEKENGRIYTPDYIVNSILNLSGYTGPAILKKHVIDNSCGDGAFLVEIVRRYCSVAKEANLSPEEIREDLMQYIHGIEIESTELDKCRERITQVAAEYDIKDVNWNLLCGDTLMIHDFDGKMDFVLGNPPYVRVHNLGTPLDVVKSFSFAQGGMTDLFIVFYEIGIRMLTPNGVLGYITPSSFFNSVAGAYMRQVLVRDCLLDKIVDLKHYQAFSSTTYTTIAILRQNKTSDSVDYYRFDESDLKPQFVEALTPDDYYLGGNFYFAKKKDLQMLKEITANQDKCDISVKNGYATLCDSVFIGKFPFRSRMIIPVIKASKGIKQQIIYPYDRNAKLFPERKLKRYRRVYQYLLSKKDILINRSNEKDKEMYWYAFGRSQALLDTYKDKLTINTLLRDEQDLKCVEAPAGVGVYGGLYIISDTFSHEDIISTLKTPEFAAYIALLAKYKSGGYYTFSSKDIQAYLDYKFCTKEE